MANARQVVKAIYRGDTAQLSKLSTAYGPDLAQLLKQPAQLGATPIQWAQWIQDDRVLAALALPQQCPLALLAEGKHQTLDRRQTLARFGYRPIDTPCFENANSIGWTIRYLRGLFAVHFFQDSCLWHAAHHQNDLANPHQSHFLVQPINTIVGHGVVSTRLVATGSYIGEYVGEINCRHLFSPPRDTTYVMEYPVPALPGFRWSIDALRMGNFTRFINHSDTPNCQIAVAYDGFIFRILVLAKITIQAGEELTLNYGTAYWRHRSILKTKTQEPA